MVWRADAPAIAVGRLCPTIHRERDGPDRHCCQNPRPVLLPPPRTAVPSQPAADPRRAGICCAEPQFAPARCGGGAESQGRDLSVKSRGRLVIALETGVATELRRLPLSPHIAKGTSPAGTPPPQPEQPAVVARKAKQPAASDNDTGGFGGAACCRSALTRETECRAGHRRARIRQADTRRRM